MFDVFLESGDMMIGVFLDFKKAFDYVDHDISLCRMYASGIRAKCMSGLLVTGVRSNDTSLSQYGLCSCS